jgi:hypothetical protein
VRLRPLEEQVAVFFSPDEYEHFLDCVPDRRARLALRIEAESSPRAGIVTQLRRGDFFVPDNPEVKIAFLRIRGSKDTTEGENALDGAARITWVPDDLYQEVMAYCEEQGIADDEELFPDMGYEYLRQFVVEARENAAKRSGDDDYLHITTHDFRRYYATNMVRRERVDKELVMELGDWNSHEAIDPYLDVSQPKDIQDGLARAGVLDKDVPAPPRRDDFTAIHRQLKEIKRALVTQEVTTIDGVDMELLEEVKEKYGPNGDADQEEDEEETGAVEYEQSTLDTGLNGPERANSYLPVVGQVVGGGSLMSSRLRKEWLGFTDGGADWVGPRDLAIGAVLVVAFLVGIGVNMAASGVWFDLATLTFHASPTDALGIFLGSTLGVLKVLWADYRVRIAPS